MGRDLHRRLARLERDTTGDGMHYVVRMAASVAEDEAACKAAVAQAVGATPKPNDTLIILKFLDGCPPTLVNSWRSSGPGAGR